MINTPEYQKLLPNVIDNIWTSDLFFQLLFSDSDIQRIYRGYLKHITSENGLYLPPKIELIFLRGFYKTFLSSMYRLKFHATNMYKADHKLFPHNFYINL